MTDYAQFSLSLGSEQFRMSQLQVFNWGTFGGIHTIPIAERGFLFIGRSGAGKSTLLDAFSTLLTPPRWVDFNAAAREAERSSRDRSLVTYIRGAWAEQKDEESGIIVTRYLRPQTTWSAVSLTYQNQQQQKVTLIQLFWVRGNSNNNADVKRLFIITERSFDLKELDEFGQTNFDVRRLKQTLHDSYFYDEFRPYCDRFCRYLGIENEMALRLLHKTQSAKNLGDLNTFLRDFMLDKPETFEVAERLVSEFNELDAAYQVVVRARNQIKTLVPVREQHEKLLSAHQERNLLTELQLGINHYTELKRIILSKEQLAILAIKLQGIEGDLQNTKTLYQHETNQLQLLEQQHREQGGDRIEQWQREKCDLEIQRENIIRKHTHVSDTCKQLNWPCPVNSQSFAEMIGRARHEIETWDHRSQETRDKQFQLKQDKNQNETVFIQVKKEIEALKRQPSNIPAQMLELRREITAALGVAENAMPFVGELIEVKQDESAWQGAIERVLHGFALSLLVDDRYYTALATYLNQTDLKHRRLVYYKTARTEKQNSKFITPESLLSKISLKESPHTEWLQQELFQRFNYACVDNLQSFRQADRALTIQGQIKHNKTRHEKDDRISVNDRQHWVLGFNNREKLAIYEKQAQHIAQIIAELQQALNNLSQHEKQLSNIALLCQSLINLQWQEVDASPQLLRINQLDEALRNEQKNASEILRQLSARIEQQKERVSDINQKLIDTTAERNKIRGKMAEHDDTLSQFEKDTSITSLTPHQQHGLDIRFDKLNLKITLDNLDKAARTVVQHVADELKSVEKNIQSCIKIIENQISHFIREWPAESNGLDASIDAAPDFIAKLLRLETDGLPAHEKRFFELLQNQSDQNLATLSHHLRDARKTILERMELVNDSLKQVPFNQTLQQRTYLRIEVSDKQLSDVREFKQTINETLSHAWSDSAEQAESRFTVLKQLINKLSSQEPQEKHWRNLVLDVRQHVEFIGREIDENNNEIEIYRSGAGKSGGQRQKLATTCLAAALRYQLGGTSQDAPLYAPVILDEAFDKADNEFTALAMNIFVNFGFQMIVATPLKSVMTLEPFIGGACFVDITDRRVSGILLIEYDQDKQRIKFPESHAEEAIA